MGKNKKLIKAKKEWYKNLDYKCLLFSLKRAFYLYIENDN